MPSDRTELTFATIPQFDRGRIAITVDQMLKRAVDDIRDRPGDKTARKVVVELALMPSVVEGGEVTDIGVAAKVTGRFPGYRTAAVPVMVHRNGSVSFNPDSPDNPRQRSLEEAGAEEEDDEE